MLCLWCWLEPYFGRGITKHAVIHSEYMRFWPTLPLFNFPATAWPTLLRARYIRRANKVHGHPHSVQHILMFRLANQAHSHAHSMQHIFKLRLANLAHSHAHSMQHIFKLRLANLAHSHTQPMQHILMFRLANRAHSHAQPMQHILMFRLANRAHSHAQPMQHILRVGQNRVCTPYMAVIWINPCLKHIVCTVYAWIWPTLQILLHS